MSDNLKTRLLRRYEAGANVCATDAGDPALGILTNWVR